MKKPPKTVDLKTKLIKVGDTEVDASPDMTQAEAEAWVAEAIKDVPIAPEGDKPD